MALYAPGRCLFAVALRKESVDRNNKSGLGYSSTGVALRKESVDRNISGWQTRTLPHWSLSARRAWIEILGSRLYDMSAACRSPQGERG